MELLQQDREHAENAAFIKVIDPLIADIERIVKYIPTVFDLSKSADLELIGKMAGLPRPVDGAITDDIYRKLLASRLAKNNSINTIADIEVAILNIVSSTRVEIVDNLDMSFTVRFIGELTEFERNMIRNYDIIPRPAGVKIAEIEETALSVEYDTVNYDQSDAIYQKERATL